MLPVFRLFWYGNEIYVYAHAVTILSAQYTNYREHKINISDLKNQPGTSYDIM